MSKRFLHGVLTKKHAEKVWNDNFELANKSVPHLKRVGTPCIDDHYLEKDDCEIPGEMAAVRAQIALKCFFKVFILIGGVGFLKRPIQRNTVSLNMRTTFQVLLFSEPVSLWI